jgi:glyoxylase-like metal-dependent hydrolase (beta-lactamase superfamily II)
MPVMTIGKVPLHRVEELRISNTIAYFTQDEALLTEHRHWLAPHFLDAEDRFDLVFQSWIFESEGRVVLVDPCTGNDKPHPVPYFDRLDVPYIERMEATGVRPADVDYVVCTHLHHDHCGWNTELRDGRWVPTFPNARYIIQQTEFDRWGPQRDLHPEFAYNEGVFERSVQPIIDAGLADLVSGVHRISPDLVVEPAPGHTLGHQLLHLSSDDSHALFSGDCFHHPIQLVEPSIPFGDAEDLEQAIATRLALAERAADLGALLIPAHLDAPHAVRVWREDGKLRFAAAGATD